MIDLTSISRFAAHVLAVRPVLGKELHEPAAFTRAEMAAALEGAKADDEAAFKRRLRPYGDSGPLVASYDFLEQYFVTQGREWERYAWIKARAVTGSAHDELDKIVRPFVFRKYLDYATLDAMRGLHAEVRRDVERRELAGHVKLGPGGIREVEFIAQALQLIRGGRDASLTVRPTLAVLAVPPGRQQFPPPAAPQPPQAHGFPRPVEAAPQYLDDAQRHDLPEDAEDQRRIPPMLGFQDSAAC